MDSRRQQAFASRALTVQAVALGFVDVDQRRELCLESILRRVDLAERLGDLLLLQLVVDRSTSSARRSSVAREWNLRGR